MVAAVAAAVVGTAVTSTVSEAVVAGIMGDGVLGFASGILASTAEAVGGSVLSGALDKVGGRLAVKVNRVAKGVYL